MGRDGSQSEWERQTLGLMAVLGGVCLPHCLPCLGVSFYFDMEKEELIGGE